MYNTKRDVLLVRVESETANKLPLLIPILGTTTSTIYPLYSYTGTGTQYTIRVGPGRVAVSCPNSSKSRRAGGSSHCIYGGAAREATCVELHAYQVLRD